MYAQILLLLCALPDRAALACSLLFSVSAFPERTLSEGVAMQTSIVPEAGHVTYLLLDELQNYGPVWREMSADEANETTIVQWIIEGQIERPLKIVAFNTEDGWSRDVTRGIATKLLHLGAAAREFVERVTGKSATAIV